MKTIKNLLKNPQIYQTIFLMIVINLGIMVFGLYLDYTKFFLIFGSTLLLDMLFGYIRFGKLRFPFSGINAGFGISFFLRTDFLLLYFFAALLAIGSKYLLQFRDKHFLNPSNFGVFMILVFFPQISWTNPLQWTANFDSGMPIFFIYSLIIFLGFSIIFIVNRVVKINLGYVVIPFLLVHMVLYKTIAPYETFSTLWQWYTPSFFIFVFFMLTDPMILPKNNMAKIGFAINVAILPYILQFFINENYAHLAALFLMTLLLPLGRYITIKNEKSASEKYLYFGFFLLFVVVLTYCIYRFGWIDLVFDNRCRKLFCL